MAVISTPYVATFSGNFPGGFAFLFRKLLTRGPSAMTRDELNRIGVRTKTHHKGQRLGRRKVDENAAAVAKLYEFDVAGLKFIGEHNGSEWKPGFFIECNCDYFM